MASITYEQNEYGETVTVTTTQSGVVRALYRPTPVVEVEDPCKWLLDVGPFFDRFGPAKMAILTSTEPVVKAMREDAQARHWINLQRPEVIASVKYMRGVTIPGLGTIEAPIAGLDLALETWVLETPAFGDENLVLRKMYFS